MGGRMSADFIAPGGVGGGYEPQRKFNFELQLDGVDGRDDIRLAIVRAFLPPERSEEIALPFGNSRVYVAGPRIYGEGRIAVRDFIDRDTFGILRRWRATVQDEMDNIGYANRYKKTGSILLLGPDAEETAPARSYQLTGLWPRDMTPGDLSYEEPGIVLVEMVLRYDKAIAAT